MLTHIDFRMLRKTTPAKSSKRHWDGRKIKEYRNIAAKDLRLSRDGRKSGA